MMELIGKLVRNAIVWLSGLAAAGFLKPVIEKYLTTGQWDEIVSAVTTLVLVAIAAVWKAWKAKQHKQKANGGGENGSA